MNLSTFASPAKARERALAIRDALPSGGLFTDHTWRIATKPFPLGSKLAEELQKLGRILLKFYKSANLLYRQSAEGKQAAWVAELLDQGKPSELIQLQRSPAFKNDVPRVIRPDILLTDDGIHITELDSVPGGIGLTAWLNQTYSKAEVRTEDFELIGTKSSMIDGFASIFGAAPSVHVIVSEEAATYRPEMEWITGQLGPRFTVHDSRFTDFGDGDAVYRFFELFDLANVPNSGQIFDAAVAGRMVVSPPPKPALEEKLLSALFWNRNLHEFWRRSLGKAFFRKLERLIPYTWVVDPTPFPPHAAIPELNITDWHQLKALSHRQRQLVVKVSGFSHHAWGARGVFLGSDLCVADWSAAVDNAIRSYGDSPYILQRYHKPRLVESQWYDFEREEAVPMQGRVRLCPYYFVTGQAEHMRAHLAGVLATICPADKKIIHGMDDAILAPCSV